MPNITLYRRNGSCSLSAHCLLTYLGVPFTPVLMSVNAEGRYETADGSLTHEEYKKKVHPMGYVPALLVDGEAITETPAILTYIGSLAAPGGPGEGLLGSSAVDRARVVEWTAWLSGTLQGLGFAGLWRPYRFSDDETAFEGLRAKGRQVVDGGFARIEERLAGREHAVGDGLTVADFHLYVYRRWGAQIGIPMADEYPNYDRVMQRVEGLEAVQKILELENLKPVREL